MPPRAKFTKEQIINAALDLVRENGVDGLNARAVGNKLGTSSSPIFTVFSSMDDLKQAVFEQAREVYYSYTSDWENYTPPAKRWAMQMVTFAKKEPKLFQLLFMQERVTIPLFDKSDIENTHKIPIKQWGENLNLNAEQSHTLFYNLWIFLYGICSMYALKVCTFTDEEVSEKIGSVFAGLLMLMHSDKEEFAKISPIEGTYTKLMGIDVKKTPYTK